TASVSPAMTAADVQASLNTIPALNGNVAVTGSAGGPFTITFVNGLTGVNVPQLTVSSFTGTTAPVVAAKTQGASPTAAQLQTSLGTIAALTGNVTVTGGDNGTPFTVTIKNQANAPLLDLSTTTGGISATAAAVSNSNAAITSDLDQLTFVTSREVADAVT